MIYLTSDLHFCHDREFLWGPRGFKNVWEMNEAIITRWNSVVNPEDDVYVLGDCILHDNETGAQAMKQLKGNIHVIRGNHDTDARLELYNNIYNIVEIVDAKYLHYNGYHFYLSHYPTITSNLDDDKPLKKRTINLCGHSHTKFPFIDWNRYDSPIYHVELDSHNCYPISIDDVVKDIEEQFEAWS